jgi:hypothetical protein
VQADGVVMALPTLDQHLGFEGRREYLAVQQLVSGLLIQFSQ